MYGHQSVRAMPAPMRYRWLLPMLLKPFPTFWPKWAGYQAFRLGCLWAAFHLSATTFGLWHACLVALIFASTLRFDYWSNCVELLAGMVVLAAGVHGWDRGGLLVAGLVAGAARETVPLLALAGTPWLGIGAAISQGFIRLFSHLGPDWTESDEAATRTRLMVRENIRSFAKPEKAWERIAALHSLILGTLGIIAAPLYGSVLFAASFLFARLREPRVLTGLIPFIALWLLKR